MFRIAASPRFENMTRTEVGRCGLNEGLNFGFIDMITDESNKVTCTRNLKVKVIR
jgi:hypothetical protein